MANASRYKVSIDMTGAVAVVYRQAVGPTPRQRRKCKPPFCSTWPDELVLRGNTGEQKFCSQVCTSTSIISFRVPWRRIVSSTRVIRFTRGSRLTIESNNYSTRLIQKSFIPCRKDFMRILYVFRELILFYIYRTFETAVFDKQNFFYLDGDQIKCKIYLFTGIHILVSYKMQLKI